MTNTQPITRERARSEPSRVPEYWAETDLSTRDKIAEYERVPLADRGLPSSVYEFIRNGAMIAPDATAFTYIPDAHDVKSALHMTHREVLDRITRAANLFYELGIRDTDVVSILTANTPEPQFAMWGAQTAGIANPLNWMLEPELLGELITAVGATVLVSYGGDTTTDLWPKIESILKYAPNVETVIRAGGSRTGAVPTGVQFFELDDELYRHDGDALTHARYIEWNTVGAIFGTGGTTGAPKLARVTHGGQIYASWASAVSHRVPVGVVRFCASPMFHVHGIAVTQLTALSLGGVALFPTSAGWRGPGVVDNFWTLAQAFTVDSVPLLPTIANRLVHRPDAIPAHHPVRKVSCGSAPLSPEIAHRFRELTGVAIAEGYGLTETSGAVVGTPAGVDPVPGVVGIPVPYTSGRVVRAADDGQYVDCEIDEPGVLLLRGPGVFAGYTNSDQNAAVLLDDGWLDTGDLASMDERGFLRITGRSKDIIIRGGHNIDPAPVEDALFRHPSVADASVVGMPDPDAGEVPVAYVVADANAEIDLTDLANHVRERLRERAALPKEYFVIDDLPKSAVGKILKNRLRVDATERAFARILDRMELAGRYDLLSVDGGAAGIDMIVRLHDHDPTLQDQVEAALSSITVRHRIDARG